MAKSTKGTYNPSPTIPTAKPGNPGHTHFEGNPPVGTGTHTSNASAWSTPSGSYSSLAPAWATPVGKYAKASGTGNKPSPSGKFGKSANTGNKKPPSITNAPGEDLPILGAYPTGAFVPTYKFRVTIEGLGDPLEGFTKVSEIKMEIETIEFRSAMDVQVRKGLGRTKATDVTLERPYQGLDEFYGWFVKCMKKSDRRTVWIEFLRPNGETVRKYALYGAFPKDWALPAMDAGGSNIGIEKIVLSVDMSLQVS